jgi:hypothetical protein
VDVGERSDEANCHGLIYTAFSSSVSIVPLTEAGHFSKKCGTSNSQSRNR